MYLSLPMLILCMSLYLYACLLPVLCSDTTEELNCTTPQSRGRGFEPVAVPFHWPVEPRSLALELHRLEETSPYKL